MKRKIVQHGCSSLTVTLPSDWVKKFGLKKGDEVDIDVAGSRLMISTRHEIESPKKVVNTTEFGLFTKNNLTHLYMLGYDEIEVVYQDEKSLSEIKNRIPECIGYEIIDQKTNKIFIKSIAHTLEEDFDILLRKSWLITNQMADEVYEAVKNQEFFKLKEIRHLEFMNNKFTMTCVRILNKRGYKVHNRTLQIHEVVKGIERIADFYKYISDTLVDSKKAISKEVLDLFKRVNEYYLTLYNIFYKFDPNLKKQLFEKRKPIMEDGEELMKRVRGSEVVVVHHLLSLTRTTYNVAGSYFAFML